MQTANPVLARIDRDAAQASRSGAGFAYEEGRSAVASAQMGAAPPPPPPPPAPPPPKTPGQKTPPAPPRRTTAPGIGAHRG